MGVIVKARMILGGEVRLPGFEVPPELEAECRMYPTESWEDTAAKEAKPTNDKRARGGRTKRAK